MGLISFQWNEYGKEQRVVPATGAGDPEWDQAGQGEGGLSDGCPV